MVLTRSFVYIAKPFPQRFSQTALVTRHIPSILMTTQFLRVLMLFTRPRGRNKLL